MWHYTPTKGVSCVSSDRRYDIDRQIRSILYKVNGWLAQGSQPRVGSDFPQAPSHIKSLTTHH